MFSVGRERGNAVYRVCSNASMYTPLLGPLARAHAHSSTVTWNTLASLWCANWLCAGCVPLGEGYGSKAGLRELG